MGFFQQKDIFVRQLFKPDLSMVSEISFLSIFYNDNNYYLSCRLITLLLTRLVQDSHNKIISLLKD